MQEHRTTDSESSSSPIQLFGTLTTEPSVRSDAFRGNGTNPAEFVADLLRLPTPATSEPGFTVSPVDKDGQPTNNPNERWYHPETGRLLQKGISQVLKENDLLPTVTAQAAKHGPTPDLQSNTPLGANLWDLPHVLPTPTTRDFKDGSEPHERDGIVQTDTVARAVFNSGEILLPTTRTSMKNGATAKEVAAGNPKFRLEAEVQLFPTLRASDGYERRNQKTMDRIAAQGGDMTMPTLARIQTDWGKFEPAIKRWEGTLGRPAPAPTKPDGKEGAHRLSSAFTEWMMGVPEGWITNCGLSRNDELKACGNGVVPQQAELALRVLLQGITLPAGGGQVNLPTPTVSDTFTDNLKSIQQKEGSMHSVTLPQAVRMVAVE
jgi:hypothetical protein